MRIKKDNTPYNRESQRHGYWEYYHYNGQLCYKGNYINDKEEGYWEYYLANGKVYAKGNYVNGKKVGIWFESGKEIFYAN